MQKEHVMLLGLDSYVLDVMAGSALSHQRCSMCHDCADITRYLDEVPGQGPAKHDRAEAREICQFLP